MNARYLWVTMLDPHQTGVGTWDQISPVPALNGYTMVVQAALIS
jgi:hypothetical protein